MLVHAKQYGRETFIHEENLKNELLNLNNRLVILLPSLCEIKKRYALRGDDRQTLEDVIRLHSDFSTYTKNLISLPNVHVIDADNQSSIVDSLIDDLTMMENFTLDEISKSVYDFVNTRPEKEALPLKFTLFDDGSFNCTSSAIMDHIPEKDYYDKILSGIKLKIKNELLGYNQYNRREEATSRRFIYTNDSCISLVHASFRDNLLDIHFVLRSSEVSTTFSYDLKFLYYLSSQVYSALKLQDTHAYVRLRYNLNSAHILK